MRFVVTGGAGFFGSVLMRYLKQTGHEALSIDILPDADETSCSVRLDIRDRHALQRALEDFGDIDAIIHAAAVLAHDRRHFSDLWSTNVEGTRNVMEVARQLQIRKVIFTSSNCVFARSFDAPVAEDAIPNPIEEYGRTKLAAEGVVAAYTPAVIGVIIRCPTIIAAGRVGLLSILFDFVREGRRLYLVGDGSNRYSFIDANDLAAACVLVAFKSSGGIYHVGSDDVKPLREVYAELMRYAGKSVRLVTLPESMTLFSLQALNKLSLSPLGPYHYRMLSANCVFDTSKIKKELGWAPTRTNVEMLCDAYTYYLDHLEEIRLSSALSPHRKPVGAGIINLLRLIS